jgi:site-specific DNA-cytosine methylase
MYLAQESQCCVIENAPGLAGKEGIKVLRKIQKILNENGKHMMHISKTNTIVHGLPQYRSRCFLFIYKTDSFAQINGFKTVNRQLTRLEDFLTRPEEIGTEDNDPHVPLVFKAKGSNPWLEFTFEKDLHTKTRQSMEDFTCESVIGQFLHEADQAESIEEYVGDPEYYEVLVKAYNHIKEKAKDNLGFWDSSPVVAKGKVNAIISKNIARIIHPKYNRYLTFREAMDLMGLPDDFVVKDFKSKCCWNHICQNIPVNTAMDHIVIASKVSGLIKKKGSLVSLFSGFDIFNNDTAMGIILQDNSSGDAIGNSYYLNGNNEWEKIA